MRLLHAFALCAALMPLAATTAFAQDPTPAAPAAAPADVESIDAIVAALYDAISGGAGEPRDWDRLRSLFVPGALLVPAGPRQDGTAPVRALGVEDWIRGAETYFRDNAFYERETARELDRFGNVASAMSTYGSYATPDGEPFSRGINAITLISDGARWYVVSIAWDVDREGNPLPAEASAETP